MLKAYEVTNKYPLDYIYVTKIFWEKTPGKAKSRAVNLEELGDPEYLYLTCRRVKWADNLQGVSEDELVVEGLKHGRTFDFTGDGHPLLCKDDIPAIEDAGGLEQFYIKWKARKILTVEEKREKNDLRRI